MVHQLKFLLKSSLHARHFAQYANRVFKVTDVRKFTELEILKQRGGQILADYLFPYAKKVGHFG